MLNRRVVGGDYLCFGQMHAARGAAVLNMATQLWAG